MATGDKTVFEEMVDPLWRAKFDLSGHTFKLGVVTGASPPAADDATPQWGDYSGSQISTGGGYTGPITLETQYSEVDGELTFQAKSVTIPQNASGQGSTQAYAIMYDEDDADDSCLMFWDLGVIDITADSVTVKFNGADSGVFGNALKATVVN